MNLLADEGVDTQIVTALRRAGHEVLYVAEMAPGIGDELVLRRANEKRALLVTADRDFGELVFRQGLVHAGVVLLRLAGLEPDTRAKLVSQVIRDRASALPGSFCVISPGTVRIRRR